MASATLIISVKPQAIPTQTQMADPPETVKPPLSESGKHYEVVNGQIVEEPPLGAREVNIATILTTLLGHHVMTNKLGRMATEGLFILQSDPRLRRRPDVAFVSTERWPLARPVPAGAAWDVIPDLAIEVISPTDRATEVQDKIAEYLRAGVRQVWVVYVGQALMMVYDSPTQIRVLQRADTLDAAAILPGFQVALTEVFETDADEPSITNEE